MQTPEGSKIRNVAIIGHAGSGKTSLVESLLYMSDAIAHKGSIETGNTVSDYDPDEIRRRMSLNTSLCATQWDDHKLNLLDTPGFTDYLNDTKMALMAVDSALLVLDGVKGLEVNAQKLWNFCEEQQIPTSIFINKLDADRADFYRLLDDMQEAWGHQVIPVVLPIGSGASFEGLVNLFDNTAWGLSADGKPVQREIPAEMAADVEKYRLQLIEKIAELDDSLLERYLEGQVLTIQELGEYLQHDVADRRLTLVFGGTGKLNKGISLLLDAMTHFFPTPLDHPAVKCQDPNGGESWQVNFAKEQPVPASYVFKTVSDPYVGKISLFRVYSGTVKTDDNLYNANHGTHDRFGRLYSMTGKKQTQVQVLLAGDIGCVAKLKDTQTGDTLLAPALSVKPFLMNRLQLPPQIYSVAIMTKSKNDENKISTALHKLQEEDPSFTVSVEPATHKTIISGMGQTHVEILVERLKSRFGIAVDLSAPKIPYRETVTLRAEAQGKHKKQTGGHGQYGDAWLRLEPLPEGSGFQFASEIVGGSVPKQFVPAVEKGIHDILGEGLLIGAPIVDLKITLFDGSYHAVDSSEMSFRMAAHLALKNAFPKAKPIILEPILDVDVTIPDHYTGEVLGDLNGARRGHVSGIETNGHLQTIKAQVPMAEIIGYAPILTSLTRGEGSFSATFSHYDPLPHALQEKVISESKLLAESK